MAEGWQTPPNADVILRASGGKEFHAHKLILSLASTVFRDMFSVPQPPPTEPTQLPIVDVDDPPEALEIFLQIIYPTHNPPINNIETLVSILRLAEKYGAKAVVDAHKEYLLSMATDSPPIHLYAILCACGRKKEAEAAARRIPLESLVSLDSQPLLHLMTVEHYQRLIRFIIARNKRTREIVNRHREKIERSRDFCKGDAAHQLYSGTIASSLQAAFEENPCVRVSEALGIVSSAPLTFSPCQNTCKYGRQGLLMYAEGLLKELVEMGQTLPLEDPRAERQQQIRGGRI